MTDRQLFIEKLRVALMERGVPDEDAKFYLNDRFYDILARDSAENTALDKVELMADGIAAQVKERAGVTKEESDICDTEPPVAEAEPESETASGPDEQTIVFEDDSTKTAEMFIPPLLSFEESTEADRTVTIDSVFDEIFDEAAAEPTAEIDVVPHTSTEEIVYGEQTQTVDAVSDEASAAVTPLSDYDEEYSDYGYNENEYTYGEQNDLPDYTEEPMEEVDFDSDFSEAVQESDDTPQNRLPDYIVEKPIPNSALFWVLFGISSPVWIAILAVGFALFAAVWILLGVLIGALIAVMIAVIAVGSGAALMGIVYGVIQVASPATLSVGVYNIGLGIISAGTAMLLGIVTYNLALRLMPWLIKLVGKLFGFTLKQLKRLFNHLRRECAKQ